jgi:hypothetical protein
MFDNWTIAVYMTMNGYCPAIFRGYSVKYIRAWPIPIPKPDNDNVPRPK